MKKVLISLLVGVVSIGLVSCSSGKVVDEKPQIELKEEVVEEVVEEKEEIKEEVKDDSIKLGKVDSEPRVLPTDLPFALIVQEPDSTGTVYGNITFENKSNYPITSFELVVLDNTTNEKHYFDCYDTVLEGELSPIMESFASDDMVVLKMSYSIYDKETGLTCNYEYDTKLERLEWTSWHETY